MAGGQAKRRQAGRRAGRSPKCGRPAGRPERLNFGSKLRNVDGMVVHQLVPMEWSRPLAAAAAAAARGRGNEGARQPYTCQTEVLVTFTVSRGERPGLDLRRRVPTTDGRTDGECKKRASIHPWPPQSLPF